eukprot:CAMPEP_0197194818 /NCGR_PEP_ID=MMETSP1423-20130617/29902_1 /TAXON_ID=476441 /ORGANISM="Pseudo-nitzschia heimii, Strain UNC1101" /LENGTH=500 /DNA_ID=CAMNT_0042648303 /DNA_START=146 /DNA_END=1648 /DNA_ORIENTATION=-
MESNILIANQNWWNLTNENCSVDKNEEDRKDRYMNEDSDRIEMKSKIRTKTKKKRSFEDTAIRSVRSGHAPDRSPRYTLPATSSLTKSGLNSKECKSVRDIRGNYENRRYVSQASIRRDKRNKKHRKESVIGSLATILGPDNGGSGHNESECGIESAFETNVKGADDAVVVTVIVLPFESQKRQNLEIPSAVRKSRKGQNKRDRKTIIQGSFGTILRPTYGSLVRSDNCNNSVVGTNSPVSDNDISCNTANNRKKPTTFQISRVLKRRDDYNSRRRQVNGSPKSILGPVDESLVASVHDVHSTSKMKSPKSRTDVSSHHQDSPINGEKRSISRRLVVSSMRNNLRKETQNSFDHKYKNTQKTKSHFNEDEARRLIRARLQKNQKKYATLAVALNKAKSSKPLCTTVPSSTISLESIRAAIATPQANIVDSVDDVHATTTVSQQPVLRSRARNGRLYSVCKKIPPSIPEHMVLLLERPGLDSSKATFHPRCKSNDYRATMT